MKKNLLLILAIIILLNPFDLGLWVNKLFGDVIHYTIFAALLILAWFLLPQKTNGGKLRFLKKTFSLK